MTEVAPTKPQKTKAIDYKKQLRVFQFPDGRIFVMSNFSDKNSIGVPAQLTVYGAIFKGLDFETGKKDEENPAPWAPRTLQVRPFTDDGRYSTWGKQSFAWECTGSKCTSSKELCDALQGHWVCSETDGRVLVAVLDAGHFALNRAFT